MHRLYLPYWKTAVKFNNRKEDRAEIQQGCSWYQHSAKECRFFFFIVVYFLNFPVREKVAVEQGTKNTKGPPLFPSMSAWSGEQGVLPLKNVSPSHCGRDHLHGLQHHLKLHVKGWSRTCAGPLMHRLRPWLLILTAILCSCVQFATCVPLLTHATQLQVYTFIVAL